MARLHHNKILRHLKVENVPQWCDFQNDASESDWQLPSKYGVDTRHFQADTRHFHVDTRHIQVDTRHFQVDTRHFEKDTRHFQVDTRHL